jgi:MYXO-CTERM domain-containing protein
MPPAPSPLRRPALAALLLAAGCAGSGSGCSSCGGAFKTTGVGSDGPNTPYRFQGPRIDNGAQVRLTRSAFDQLLSAPALNQVLANLGAAGLSVPCLGPAAVGGADPLPSFCACKSCPAGSTQLPGNFLDLTKFGLIIGDANFDGVCSPGESTPVTLQFKQVTWSLDPANQLLKAKIVLHVKAALYLRTLEAHSSLCSGTTPIQGRVFIDDEAVGLSPQDTALDLDLQFATAPDGRLLIAPTDASIGALVDTFNIAALGLDGYVSSDQKPPASGSYHDNGCDAASGTYDPYNPSDATRLACSEFFNVLSGGCNGVDPNTSQGLWCTTLWPTLRQALFNQVKGLVKAKVTAVIKTQLDNLRCERPLDAGGSAIACDPASAPCPSDDRGQAESCDTARGVCVAQGQDAGKGECEPAALALEGQLDLSAATSTLGFPADARVDLFAGLGGATAPAAVSSTGLQLAARVGSMPAANTSTGVSVCVPPGLAAPVVSSPPALDFDAAANQPDSVKVDGLYDVGVSMASELLTRGFYDAFNGGAFCLSVTNKTASALSTGLLRPFLPSLGLLGGGKDAPMSIVLRPTQPPAVRIGRGTLRQNADGTFSPDDPLLTLTIPKLDLDFYAVIDDRSVRLFTLQADVALPLGLRTFPGAQADQLQPVLGGLSTALTNVTALNNEMLAEDPAVLTDLIAAAAGLAQPLLASALTPLSLPKVAGLDFQVKGIGGAVPMPAATDGYHHLGLWLQIARCGAAGQPACAKYTVGTEARLARSLVPDDLDALRGPQKQLPAAVLEVRSVSARGDAGEFSYRIDGGLWSPWLRGPTLTVRDPAFLFQGHHAIEVTSRETGDDHTQNPEPVAVDFLVSVEPPAVDLVQLSDGSVVTRARSAASQPWQLGYSYRLEGDRSWSPSGAAKTFTAAELGGRGVAVLVTDEAGRTARASLGIADGSEEAAQLAASGCSTGPQATSWSLLPLALLLALGALRRRRAALGCPDLGQPGRPAPGDVASPPGNGDTRI